ncbi:hypothetical protein BGZ94_010066 [Podila epigama]|nr:hypothetical protein BGZ94_010066 [Podila epigama]
MYSSLRVLKTKLSMFKTISVKNKGRGWMDLGRILMLSPPSAVAHKKYEVISIPHRMIEFTNGKCHIEFVLTTKCSCSSPATVPDKVLGRLYGDVEYADVTFVLEGNTTQQGLIQGDSEDTDPIQGCLEAAGTAGSVEEEQVLTAHKMVLSYWPYFQAMFNSGFSEGAAGPIRVTIKDTSMATFKALLCFIYNGKVFEEDAPTSVYLDPAMSPLDRNSWEDLFMVASRYAVLELCELAQNKLIDCLDTTRALPFLFRTAYLFPELRIAVVNFISTSCGSETMSKATMDDYRDHPEHFDILRELCEASLKKPKTLF